MNWNCSQVSLFEYHSLDLPLSEWDETQSRETRVWQHFWQLNPACGGRPVNLKSKFGDISDFFMSFLKKTNSSWLLPNNLSFFLLLLLHSLLILWQTNVSSLAELWLWSRGVICEQLCQHHWLPIHATVYRCTPGRQGAKTKKKKKKWQHGRTDMNNGERSLGEERSGVERRGRGGNHSIVSAEGKEVWIFQFYPAH